MEDIDIWRAAQLMIKNYGDRAEFESAHWADQAIAQGNVEGEYAWVKITKAVRQLLQEKPSGRPN